MDPFDTKTIPKEKIASDIELLEMFINQMKQKLQDHTYQPRMQDAIKAIQLKHKLAPKSEVEETFWGFLDGIRKSEYEKLDSKPNTKESLKAQILEIIMSLKEEVKNGTLPVKTITDAFNQGRSKESQLTYHRIGRFLSTMGFIKAKTRGGCSAIIWDDKLLSQNTFSNAQNSSPQDG
jgi:hypothetical protein